jgi:hypothetical protein
MAAPSKRREDQGQFVIAGTFGADGAKASERLGDMNPDASTANGGIGWTCPRKRHEPVPPCWEPRDARVTTYQRVGALDAHRAGVHFKVLPCLHDSEQDEGPLLHKAGVRAVFAGGTGKQVARASRARRRAWIRRSAGKTPSSSTPTKRPKALARGRHAARLAVTRGCDQRVSLGPLAVAAAVLRGRIAGVKELTRA